MSTLNSPALSLKERLRSDEILYGIFLLSGSPVITECCGTLPLDWVIIDGEAAPGYSKDLLLSSVQALNGSCVTPYVRVPSLDKHSIEHALDLGVMGILVPKVDTAEQAKEVVKSALFPPHGQRGLNPVRASGYFSDVKGYIERANTQTLVMVQIESVEAVNNVNAIAAVEGVDVLFMGMGDLALSYGQPCDLTGPNIDKARQRVLEACRKHGKIPGIFAYNLDFAIQYREEGFKFIAFGNELKIIREALLSQFSILGKKL